MEHTLITVYFSIWYLTTLWILWKKRAVISKACTVTVWSIQRSCFACVSLLSEMFCFSEMYDHTHIQASTSWGFVVSCNNWTVWPLFICFQVTWSCCHQGSFIHLRSLHCLPVWFKLILNHGCYTYCYTAIHHGLHCTSVSGLRLKYIFVLLLEF